MLVQVIDEIARPELHDILEKGRMNNELRCNAMLELAPALAQQVAEAFVKRVQEYTKRMTKYVVVSCLPCSQLYLCSDPDILHCQNPTSIQNTSCEMASQN